MSAKVVFLAYANSRSSPLPGLIREDKDVFSTMVNRTLKGHFVIHRESFATLESVNKYLEKYADCLALFHYSGHADGTAVLLDDKKGRAAGIADQLKESARTGVLRLVVLNGCSTAGQVKRLLELGVPAVIATHAPVDDSAATEFAIRFYHNISEKDMSVKNAFMNALGPAQTATMQDLAMEEKAVRHLDFLADTPDDEPLWGLFFNHKESVEDNPLPKLATSTYRSFTPNTLLNKTLFDALDKEGNPEIRHLKAKEERGEYIELADKQTVIVNVLPFPIAIHLQKLLCPVDQENDGYDKITLKRIEQIGEVFHTTTELMGFVMMSQLWELKLNNAFSGLPQPLITTLEEYFYLTTERRATFNYLPFIRTIREYLDGLNEGKGIAYFVGELGKLRELAKDNHPFEIACGYLSNLRLETFNNNVREEDIPNICETAEEMLCDFFTHLGFLYRYQLTSIQNIDIKKYRHNLKAEFNHFIVKLMRAIGKSEFNYYLRNLNLDNRCVVLLKGDIQVINAQKKTFRADSLEYLNLSPFLIDSNAFESGADLTNLMFFEQYTKNNDVYSFKNVKKPDKIKERLRVVNEEKYEPVRLQFEAFRSMILNEVVEPNI